MDEFVLRSQDSVTTPLAHAGSFLVHKVSVREVGNLMVSCWGDLSQSRCLLWGSVARGAATSVDGITPQRIAEAAKFVRAAKRFNSAATV